MDFLKNVLACILATIIGIGLGQTSHAHPSQDGAWMIAGAEVVQRSDDSQTASRTQPSSTGKTRFFVTDKDTGRPVYSRVHIQNTSGLYWPPDGHERFIRLGLGEDIGGGDTHIGEKTYAYVEPEFYAVLPKGKYTVDIFHGMEYLPENATFEVDGQNTQTVSVALRRWIDMNADGWYSGDNHVHYFSDRSALFESRAEDLNVINVLALSSSGLITNVDSFTGRPSAVSNKRHIVYVNEESRHRFLGHTILHPLKKLVYPITWGGPGEGVPGGFDYPPMAHQADKAHAQGAIVTVAHFPFPSGEIAVDVVLDKIDSIDLFTWGDPFAMDMFLDATHLKTPVFPSPLGLWYRFLNIGAKLPATAGTDKMFNVQVAGSVRTYVHLDDEELTYDNWIAGIKRGETFVTTGPMIWLTADGKPIGAHLKRREGDEILLKTRVKSAIPVEKLEIVHGGEIIAKMENPDGLLDLTLEIKTKVRKSSWFGARAYASELLDYQKCEALGTTGMGVPLMAHTSPIYVEVDDKPVVSADDAQYLLALCDKGLEWVQSKGNFEKPEHKREMIELFERAKARYRLQME